MVSDEFIEQQQSNPDSEFHFYQFFADWLMRHIENTGTDHKIRFCLRDTIHEFDIVAGYKHKRTNKYTLYSIEVKMSDFNKALIQANVRRIWFDYCYFAFPLRYNIDAAYLIHNYGKHFSVIKEFGLGVLFYDTIAKTVLHVHRAVQNKKHPPHKDFKQKIIDKLWDLEIQPDPVVIGASLADFLPELKRGGKT